MRGTFLRFTLRAAAATTTTIKRAEAKVLWFSFGIWEVWEGGIDVVGCCRLRLVLGKQERVCAKTAIVANGKRQ